MLAQIIGAVCSMFCSVCSRLCYEMKEGDFIYYACPEHGRQN